MPRIAIYARVSTKRQEEEETIDSQLGACKERIGTDGLDTSDIIIYQDKDFSGSVLERPDLDRLREDAKNGVLDRVYTFDYGRISRELLDLMLVKDELEAHGVTVISLFERITGDPAVDRLLLQIMGAVYEYERKKSAQRFLNGKKQKAHRGDVVGYNAPYGFDYIPIVREGNKKLREGKFVINEFEAGVVRMMCEWVGNEGVSTKEVARRLYKLGILPRKNKRPQWSTAHIHRILTNESIIGRHQYFKSESCLPRNPRPRKPKDKYKIRHSKKTSRRVRDRSEWIEIEVPRIIDDGLFEQVQVQLKLNYRFSPRCKKREYLFGGLIECACGAARTGEGDDRNAYYRCTDRLRTFPEPRTCNEGGINAPVLDVVAWQKLEELLTQPDLLKAQFDRFIMGKINGLKAEADVSKVESALEGLQKEERRYAKAFGAGVMTLTIYKERMADIRRRRGMLESKAKKPNMESVRRLENLDFDKVAEAFNQMLQELPYEDKLFTVRRIVGKVIATKEKVVLCGQVPVLEDLTDTQVGLYVNHRDCWAAECRQKHPI